MAAVIVFAPLAFGSVQIWAMSLLQIASFVIFLIWLAKAYREPVLILHGWRIILPAGLFALLVVLQLIPFPHDAVKVLSPASAAVYGTASDLRSDQWHPLSIHPHATLQELMSYLACLAVFIVVVNHWRRKRQILGLVKLIIFMGCLLVVIAVLQKAFWNGRLYWFYPIEPALQSRLSYIWGPYVNKNHFAGYLGMAAPLALGMALYLQSRAAGRGGRRLDRLASLLGHRKMTEALYYFLGFLVMSGAMAATLSRGGILAYCVSLATMFLLVRRRRSMKGSAVLVLVAVLTIAAVGFFAAGEQITERFSELSDIERVARTRVWTDLIALVKDYPLLGSGLGTFDRAFLRYQTAYSTVRFDHAENDYLEALTDTGLFGLVLILGALTVLTWTVVKAWSERKNAFSICVGAGCIASVSAILTHSVTDFNLRVPANAMLFAVIVGLTMTCMSTPKEADAVHADALNDTGSSRGCP